MLDRDLEEDTHFIDECKSCEDYEKKMSDAGMFLGEIVELLYGEDEFNLASFENCMEELCGLLKVEFNPKLVNIDFEDKNSSMDDLLEVWKSSNTEYLKGLVK